MRRWASVLAALLLVSSGALAQVTTNPSITGSAGQAVQTLFSGWSTATCGTAQLANVSTTETDLCLYSMPGNTLARDGQRVRITVWGSFAANANVKTVSVYFGSTVVFTFGGAQNNTKWKLSNLILRTGLATQASEGDSLIGIGTGTVAAAAPTENLAGPVTIKTTAQSTTAGGDITLTSMTVERLP